MPRQCLNLLLPTMTLTVRLLLFALWSCESHQVCPVEGAIAIIQSCKLSKNGAIWGSLFRTHRYRARLAGERCGRECPGQGRNDGVDERGLCGLSGHRAFLARERCECEC